MDVFLGHSVILAKGCDLFGWESSYGPGGK